REKGNPAFQREFESSSASETKETIDIKSRAKETKETIDIKSATSEATLLESTIEETLDLASAVKETIDLKSITASDRQALKDLLAQKKDQEPRFFLAFNCKVCSHRSQKLVSKVAFQKGTVIIRCSQCKNLHLIS